MKPIIFNTEMVKAILDGRKIQTRRIVKPVVGLKNFIETDGKIYLFSNLTKDEIDLNYAGEFQQIKCPYEKGMILWVRETWGLCPDYNCVRYKSDKGMDNDSVERWKPSIHMFKKYARIFLGITNVRVERIQDISENDIWEEGMIKNPDNIQYPLTCFSVLWDKINEKRGYGWDVNPWVWVIKFKRRNNE